MAKKLSPAENKSFTSLEQNMDARVLAYKKEKEQQFKDGKKDTIHEELRAIDAYLVGCQKSEIADTLTNIQFARRKKEVLQKILE